MRKPLVRDRPTSAIRDPKGTSDAESAFVTAFLTGPSGVRFNATRSVLAAGYAMTERSAAQYGSRLLRRPRVQALLERHRRRADLTVDRVLEEWKRLAFSDMGDFADWGPDGVTIIAKADLTDDQRPALSEVRERRRILRRTFAVAADGNPVKEEVEEREVRIRLHSKIEALVNLSKYLGILKERAPEDARPLFPKGFFAALVTGDVEKIQGFAPDADLSSMKRIGPRPVTKPEQTDGMKRQSRVSEPMSQVSEAAEPAPEAPP